MERGVLLENASSSYRGEVEGSHLVDKGVYPLGRVFLEVSDVSTSDEY